jgi:hypothetical protein
LSDDDVKLFNETSKTHIIKKMDCLEKSEDELKKLTLFDNCNNKKLKFIRIVKDKWTNGDLYECKYTDDGEIERNIGSFRVWKLFEIIDRKTIDPEILKNDENLYYHDKKINLAPKQPGESDTLRFKYLTEYYPGYYTDVRFANEDDKIFRLIK